MASQELRVALEAAQAAAEVIRESYRKRLAVSTKSDRTPVTEADLRAEEVIRARLEHAFPGYGFLGEETGRRASTSESTWLVDPIDGTKSFIREIPFFSTQIALMRGGELVLGVSSAPLYGEIAWAERGAGAYINHERVRVSATTDPGRAFISMGNLKSLAGSARWPRLGALVERVDRVRGYGDFLHYHLLARGALDVVIESDVHILDIAALAVLVGEAGGVFTDLEGRRIGLESRSVLATNAALHRTMRDALAG